MSAQVQVNITQHWEALDGMSALLGRSASRTPRMHRRVLAHLTAEMDDQACAAMLRGIADVLDPPVDTEAQEHAQ